LDLAQLTQGGANRVTINSLQVAAGQRVSVRQVGGSNEMFGTDWDVEGRADLRQVGGDGSANAIVVIGGRGARDASLSATQVGGRGSDNAIIVNYDVAGLADLHQVGGDGSASSYIIQVRVAGLLAADQVVGPNGRGTASLTGATAPGGHALLSQAGGRGS